MAKSLFCFEFVGGDTGKEYQVSLRDGRVVYKNGEKIDDVTTHPAYRNAARSISRLYVALHDQETKDILTTESEFGFLTHKFFKASKSTKELLGARDAIALLARLSYGFMGRTTDYKAAFTGSLGPFPTFIRCSKKMLNGGIKKL